MFFNYIIFTVLCSVLQVFANDQQLQEHKPIGKPSATKLYTIRGSIPLYPAELILANKWLTEAVVSLNEGDYQGFIGANRKFVISGVPSGSYTLTVYHPEIAFQSVRVEISSKGKYRVRKLDHLQPALVEKLPYPIRLRMLGRMKFFRNREQWRIMDLLLNPMVLLMVVPLLLMLIMPRLINDAETARELEKIQFPKVGREMPDLSEMFTTLFLGKPKPAQKAIAAPPKR